MKPDGGRLLFILRAALWFDFYHPVAFATTVPVEALTNRLNWVTLLVAFILAVVLFVASRVFWKMGLKHYSGTSA